MSCYIGRPWTPLSLRLLLLSLSDSKHDRVVYRRVSLVACSSHSYEECSRWGAGLAKSPCIREKLDGSPFYTSFRMAVSSCNKTSVKFFHFIQAAFIAAVLVENWSKVLSSLHCAPFALRLSKNQYFHVKR